MVRRFSVEDMHMLLNWKCVDVSVEWIYFQRLGSISQFLHTFKIKL